MLESLNIFQITPPINHAPSPSWREKLRHLSSKIRAVEVAASLGTSTSSTSAKWLLTWPAINSDKSILQKLHSRSPKENKPRLINQFVITVASLGPWWTKDIQEKVYGTLILHDPTSFRPFQCLRPDEAKTHAAFGACRSGPARCAVGLENSVKHASVKHASSSQLR